MRVDVALVHYPVVSRIGETIGSAVTNLDLHDIARAGRTFGVTTYWVVTPFHEQQELAGQIVGHWIDGHGGRTNPDRSDALSIIRVCATLDEAMAGATARHGARPCVLATCARERDNTVDFAAARERIWQGEPVLLLLGTAWGLAPEVLAMADGVLPPIRGVSGFNHLSVRSAAAILFDRLLGAPPEPPA
ncbi:MAG: RNA methyltransferase [Opitutae bacterium]|nr:RNA methyltransferase [Opitutae bacterium]